MKGAGVTDRDVCLPCRPDPLQGAFREARLLPEGKACLLSHPSRTRSHSSDGAAARAGAHPHECLWEANRFPHALLTKGRTVDLPIPGEPSRSGWGGH